MKLPHCYTTSYSICFQPLHAAITNYGTIGVHKRRGQMRA